MNKGYSLQVFVLSFLMVFSFSVNSQIDSIQPKWIVKSNLKDAGHLWTSPLRIQKKDWKYIAPIAAVTIASVHYDEDIYKEISHFRDRNSFIKESSGVITHGGDPFITFGTSCLFYFGGKAFNDEKLEQTGAIAFQALAHAGVVVYAGKIATGRQRPEFMQGKDQWHWFPESLDIFSGAPDEMYTSFPSGHTITAWTLATVVAKQYKETKWVPPVAYTYATAVSLSRITEDKHWLSDVIVGAALGYGIGNYFANQHKNTKWTLLPTAWNKQVYLTFNYSI